MAKSKIPIRPPLTVEPSPVASAWEEVDDLDALIGNGKKESTPLWFRDPQKLLAAVIKHATTSREFARAFVSAAGTLAAPAEQKELRTEFRRALILDAPKSAGRSPKELWFCTVLETEYVHLRNVQGMKSGDAYEHVGNRHHLSASRVRDLVARSKKHWAVVGKSNISKQDASS